MRRDRRQTLIALLSCAAALLAAEWGLRLSGVPERLAAAEMFSAKWLWLDRLQHPIRVAVLGNSRVRHGVDSAELAERLGTALGRPMPVFNFGMGGVTGQVLLAQTLRLLDRGTPELAVFVLSPTDVIPTTPPELARLVLDQLWRPLDLGAMLRAGMPVEDSLAAFLSSLSAGMRHRTRLLDWLWRDLPPGAPLPVDPLGYKAEIPIDLGLQASRAGTRAGGYRTELVGAELDLSPAKTGCIEQAVRQLRTAGVTVVLVDSPAASAVRALDTEPYSLVPAYRKWAREMAERRGARWAEYAWPADLSDRDFTDGDHLNRDGARRFTRALVETVLLPELGKSASEK